jgi:creatinine amidohydrolase/Fe(II)-dependent formamide hydrolase-like protein
MNRQLAHMTTVEIGALNKDPGVLLLPIGAIEQHGPHLPVQTDAEIVSHVLAMALAALPDSVRAWALPTLPYGKSNEHTGFSGTFSLSAVTLLAVLRDIADGAKASGFLRMAFVNGHGGNMAVLDVAARDIRAATGLMCFNIAPHVLVEPPFELDPRERRLGFHAGEIETSVMLALTPELVHMDKAPTHFANFPADAGPLYFFGAASVAWLSRDWSQTGVFGDARAGTREKGREILDAAAARLAEIITKISTFAPMPVA